MIGRYNSTADPHCGVARSKRTQRRIQSNSSPKRKTRLKKNPGHSRGEDLCSTSTKSSGLTFQTRPPGSDPAKELQVLKCIVLRENYIERLKQLTKKKSTQKETLFDLIELTRDVTLQVIENIILWRRSVAPGAQFIWNGVNYLLRIPSDMDFLDRSSVVRSWIDHAQVIRNPFLINRTLDESPACFASTHQVDKVASEGSEIEAAAGRKRKRMSSTTTSQQRDIKRRGAPCESRSGDQKNLPTSPQSQQRLDKRESLDYDGIREPVDMIRVLEAEKILLQEELTHGRFTRNDYGLLVPVELGKDEENVHGTRTKTIPPPRSSVSTQAGQTNPEQSDVEQEQNGSKGLDRKRWPNGMYLIEKAKQGGDLVPISKKGNIGKKLSPVSRSRAAKIELDIRHAKKENEVLEKELFKKIAALNRAKEDFQTMQALHHQQELMNTPDPAPSNKDPAQLKRELLVKESYVRKVENEVELKRQELEHKKNVVERKEALRDELRKRQQQDQKRVREETISRKHAQAAEFVSKVDIDVANGEEQVAGNPDDPDMHDINFAQPGEPVQKLIRPEHGAATQMQRIVRGGLGRARFTAIFQQKTSAALSLQSWFRMLKGRARAAEVRQLRDSIVLVQSLIRGFLGRRRVTRIRLSNLRLKSSTLIQKTFRGYRGRLRSQWKRDLLESGSASVATSISIYSSDLEDLARVKVDEVEPHLLSLMQCCLAITARGTRAPPHKFEHLVGWKACKRALRRPFFLAKVKALAVAAKSGVLFLHPDRAALAHRHLLNPELTCKNLALVVRGSRVAQLLFQWLSAVLRCHQVVHHFMEPDAASSPEWFEVLRADDPEGLELWEPSELDYDSDKIDPEKYVSEEVLRCNVVRPRPLFVAVSLDVPQGARKILVDQLKRALPGTFAHVKLTAFTMSNLQDILHSGQSIILDVSIGMSNKERNAFLRKMSVAKATLEPHPLFVLVKGCEKNRGKRGLAQFYIEPQSSHGLPSSREELSLLESINWPSLILEEEETLTGTKDIVSEQEADSSEDRQGIPESARSWTGLQQTEIDESSWKALQSDRYLKQCLEDKSSSEFLLATPSSHRQLCELSQVVAPHPCLVLLLEAIMILLTPSKVFSGPNRKVASVSWEQASGFLTLPTGVLSERMSQIDPHMIPTCNVHAVQAYFEHNTFPHSSRRGEDRDVDETLRSLPIAKALLWWVESVMNYVSHLEENGGPPKLVSKGNSEIFSSVLVVKDGLQVFPKGYEPRQDRWPVRRNGDLMLQSDGWKNAFTQIMAVTLREIKVYSAAVHAPVYSMPITQLSTPKRMEEIQTKSPKRRLVVSIHRDPLSEAFFFIGYDPLTSQNYCTMLKTKDINKLLGPNSIEMRDPRQPPRNARALYQRLLELVVLERPHQPRVGAPPLPLVMALRRKKRRLLRTVRKIDSTTSTITASEASPGELIFDAYVAETSTRFNIVVEEGLVKKICKSSSSEREKRDLLSKDGSKMVLHLLDRLTIRRATAARPSEMVVHHGIVPGRKVFEGSVSISGQRHLVSVHVSSATKSLRVVTYYPLTSFRSEFTLSQTARLQLLGSLNEGMRTTWLNALFARLHLHKPKSVNEFGRTMSGSSSENIDDQEKVVVLDKSLFKTSLRVPGISMDDADSSAKPGALLLLIEFCVPSNYVLIEGQDDDHFYEDDLSVADEGCAELEERKMRPALEVLAFDRVSGKRFRLHINEQNLSRVLNGQAMRTDPATFGKIAHLLRMVSDSQSDSESTVLGLCDQNQNVLQIGAVKYPEGVEQREATESLEKEKDVQAMEPNMTKALQPLPQVISAELEVENLDAVRTIPVAERSQKPDGTRIYEHGHRMGGSQGRYVIVSVWDQGEIDETVDNSFYTGDEPMPKLFFHAYDPSTGDSSSLGFLSRDELRSAAGPRQDLVRRGQEEALIQFLLEERLFLGENEKEEEEEEKEGTATTKFALAVKKAKLYSIEKVTPVTKQDAGDALVNVDNPSKIILPGRSHDPSASRGVKIHTSGLNILLVSDTNENVAEYHVVTVFELGEEELLEEQGGGYGPRLRLQAYNAKSQTSTVLEVSASEAFEAIGGDRELFTPLARKKMCEELLSMLRIKRSLDRSEADLLVMPWARIRQERVYAAPKSLKGSDENGKKLFSRALHSANGVSVIVSAMLVQQREESKPPSGQAGDANIDKASNEEEDPLSNVNLWIQVYDTSLSKKLYFRVPPSTDKTRSVIQDALSAETNPVSSCDAIVQFLQQQLVVQHKEETHGDKKVSGFEVYLKCLQAKQASEKDQVEDHREEETKMREQSNVNSLDVSSKHSRMYLLPNVVSRSLLARRVAKVSGLYSIITAHELVDAQDNNLVRGIYVRAYCPTVSQQACTSVEFDSEWTVEQRQERAQQVVNKVDIIFDGVESHMKLIVKE